MTREGPVLTPDEVYLTLRPFLVHLVKRQGVTRANEVLAEVSESMGWRKDAIVVLEGAERLFQ